MPVHKVLSTEIIDHRKKTTNCELRTQNWRQRRLGFTLIELLVVIAIIAILVTIAVAAFGQAGKKSRDAKRKGDLDAIKKALELAKLDCGGDYFPAAAIGQAVFSFRNYYSPGEVPPDKPLKIYLESLNYIKKGPTDPKGQTPQLYYYLTANSGDGVVTSNTCPDTAIDGDSNGDDGSSNYRFWTTLENSNDPNAAESQSRCPWPFSGVLRSSPYSGGPVYVVCPN